jgi:hypothetical protein
MLSEVFFTFLITSVIGLIMGIARMLYKSKCRQFSCCGFHIDRDVEGEERLDEMVAIRRTTTDEEKSPV